MRRLFGFMGLAGLLSMAPSIESLLPAHSVRSRTIGGWKPSGNTPHQGKQEMARRRRQIERGQLRAENGLMRSVA